MRLRGKLLILLLATSVVPLLIAAAIGQASTRRVGFGLAEEQRADIERRTELLLKQIVEDDAQLFKREAVTLSLSVVRYATDAARLLAGQTNEGERTVISAAQLPVTAYTPPQIDGPPLFSRDIDDRADELELTTARGYERLLQDGTSVPLRVTFTDQSFLIPEGARGFDDEIRKLRPLVYSAALLHLSHRDMIRWIYLGLESGLHSSFPGHGGFPEGYDPRDRPWYVRTRDIPGGTTWNPPIVDASTRKVMITVAAPLPGPDGTPLGVAAVDIELPDLLEPAALPKLLGTRGQSYLVSTPTDLEASELDVFAQRGYEEGGGAWDEAVAQRSLGSPDTEPFRRMLSDLAEHRAGVQRMSHGGTDSLWAYASLGDSDGTSTGALILTLPYEDAVASAEVTKQQAENGVYAQLYTNLAALLTVICIVIVLALLASRKLSRPILELVSVTDRIASGDLDARATVDMSDEIGQLASALNEMTPRLKEHLRLRESLDLAMEVQQNLLPKSPPSLAEFDVAGSSRYCDETGGDYYDFLELTEVGPGTLGIAIGDVTGHGIAAALLMTTARALLRAQIDVPGTLPEKIDRLNRQLSRDTSNGRFMTFCAMIADGPSRSLRWVSAGHDPALVYDPAADEFVELEGADIPLGVDGGWEFGEHHAGPLPEGAVVMLGTDGIWEARDPAGAMFGKDRLREVIRAHRGGTADEISQAITAAVDAFRDTESQLDDITLVVFRFT
ncbi:MAG: SpoIIE family protein phosphatase [Planctomycetota bacterium]